MSGRQLEARRLEQRPVAELQPHPQAAEVPPLGENEYEALRADIAARGLRTAIEVTAAGVVLDGRARLRACRELGHELIAVHVVGPDNELEHIFRAALQRRHLDASQRAALALKLVPYEDLRAQARERQHANLRQGAEVATLPARVAQGGTRDLVAGLAGTSPRTAQDVITVHEHDLELYEQILRGDRKANTAASEIRQTLRDAELAAAAPPLPEGPYDVVYADPPWRLPGSPTSSRAVENHYPTMPREEIKAIKIPAAENSLLFLWGVNSMTPEALELIAAWGFSYLTNFAWCKDKWGLGQYNRCQHELLHLGRRGKVAPPPTKRRQSSVIDARRGRHSEKPLSVYELIETMYPHASKLELFARGTPRPGWAGWGNEATSAEAAT
jgi:N6-adenosine-specific RNA methylase IME4/ParB-like chromosome segregation protein Spo0J